MKLPLRTRSDYYKALLVLARRDRIIDPRERILLIRIGEILDFDRRFCEAAIDDLLSNVHISRTPIIFHDDSIKRSFFRDALRVAFADGCIHPKESSWLRQMARANGMSDSWLDAMIMEFLEYGKIHKLEPFEIQSYI